MSFQTVPVPGWLTVAAEVTALNEWEPFIQAFLISSSPPLSTHSPLVTTSPPSPPLPPWGLPALSKIGVYSCLGDITLPILACCVLYFADIRILFFLGFVFSIWKRWNEVLGGLIEVRSGMEVPLPWAEVCQGTNSVLICVAVDSVITTKEGVLGEKDWRSASANLKCCCLLFTDQSSHRGCFYAFTMPGCHLWLLPCGFIFRGGLLSKCMKVNSKLCICFKFSGSWEDVTSAWYSWGILEGHTCLSCSYHSFCSSSSLVPLTFDPAAWQDCSRPHCLML